MLKLRLAIVGLLLAGAATLLYLALSARSTLTRNDFMLNVGTEVLGIAVTVGMVEWLLEMQKRREGGKTIAWKALHEIDLAFWLWQGGTRSFNVSELWHLVMTASPTDPMMRETRIRFFNIGALAENTLRIDLEQVKSQRGLRTALQKLSTLTTLLETDQAMPAALLQNVREALSLLAKIHHLPDSPRESARLVVQRDPSLAAQEHRHYGKNYGANVE